MATYIRKTRDEYEIMGLYDTRYGLECVTTEDTYKAAKEQIKCYRDNEPGTYFKIVKRRVRI